MRQNLVPTYRFSLSTGLSRKISKIVGKLMSLAKALEAFVQGLGSAADGALLSVLRWLGKQAIGRELDVVEAGKLLLFLHKVVIVVFIAGYVIGYFVR